MTDKHTYKWANKRVMITGGASFIGSSLADALLERGARVRVVDNLTSGKLSNIQAHADAGSIDFHRMDARELTHLRSLMDGCDIVFHLAADHGGRGYVDLHQADCATNFGLDGIVFLAARQAGVEKIVFASSGCVYPNHVQTNPDETLYLHEDVVRPPHDADNTYGWAKLMGEITLKAYHDQYGMKTASCRYFTVYGPRGVENHAVIAMIARAFVGENPFQVWGTGEQIRNWTYIDDIVEGTILAAERIDDGTPVNLGTMERIRVADAAREVLRYMGRADTPIQFRPDMPTGPYNRVADNRRAKELLGWEPKVSFWDGLHRTIDWYVATKEREAVQDILEHMLVGR